MTVVEIEQLLLIGGKLEEVALLLDPFHRRPLRADAFALLVEFGLIRVVVGLVAHRIPAGILAEVNVARRLHPLPDADRRAMMALLGGADEVIVGAVEPLHHLLEKRHVALHQLPRRELFLRRGLQHLDAVLVGAGEEEHVVAVEPHEAGDRVGGDRLVGVADMRRAIGIGDGGSDVIAGLVGHRSVPSSAFSELTEKAGTTNSPPTESAGGPRPGHDASPLRYQPRDASASQPKTLKTSGLRSRLYSST